MKILVVDDEYVSLKKMKILMSGYGDVDTASSGREALDKFSKSYWDEQFYDLITIDIEMPDMTGLELLERIIDQEKLLMITPAKKIIITAEGTAENLAIAYKYKVSGFIVKPVQRLVLDKKLSSMGFARLAQ